MLAKLRAVSVNAVSVIDEALDLLSDELQDARSERLRQAGMAVTTLRGYVETLYISGHALADVALRRSSRERFDALLHRWQKRLLLQADVEVTFEGLEHLDGFLDEAFVWVSNHRATYDPIVLFATRSESQRRQSLRMVVKRELMQIPGWGAAMRASGFITVDRQNPDKAKASLKQARQTSPEVDVWIAPEGTRTLDGKLGPFKMGGFHLATESGRRIMPIALIGTEDIAPVGSYLVRSGARVTVRIGEPIDPAQFGGDLKALCAHTREVIQSLYEGSIPSYRS